MPCAALAFTSAATLNAVQSAVPNTTLAAAAGIAPGPVSQRQAPWLLGAAPADADMVQYQPFDLCAVRRAQRLVVERG